MPWEEEWEYIPMMMGSYWGTSGKVKTRQIGFIRKEDVQQTGTKNPAKGKRPAPKGAPKKGKKGTGADR